MNSLFTGQWITQHQNVLITGPTGVGKTFIACALAQAGIRLDDFTGIGGAYCCLGDT